MEPTTQNITATAFRFAAVCAKCSGDGASVEVIAPGGLPQAWDSWSAQDRANHLHYTDASRWRLLYSGVYAGTGTTGDPISEPKAANLYAMLHPINLEAVRDRFWDALGWCFTCEAFYCARHWYGCTGGGGYLMCPRDHVQKMDRYG